MGVPDGTALDVTLALGAAAAATAIGEDVTVGLVIVVVNVAVV